MAKPPLKIKRDRNFDINLFEKPQAVGYFSLRDNDRKYSSGAENLRYLYQNNLNDHVNFDLNPGIDTFINKPTLLENDIKLDEILRWISDKKMLVNLLQEEIFVCWKGVLAMLLKTPYEKKEDWLICATKVNDVIFLCPFYTDKKKQTRKNGDEYENQQQFSYWGYKFEQYMLTDDPSSAPNTSETVDATMEFCMMFRNKLENHNLLYCAEVDGTDATENINDKPDEILRAKFVELKTSLKINFKKKLLKFWAQAFLDGTEKIICGLRNRDGTVLELKTFFSQEIPDTVNGLWSSRVCVGFLNKFLQFVRDSLKNEADFTVWKFYWRPGYPFIFPKRADTAEHNILPEWFLSECKRCKKGL